jgi:2-C-methyl-D-erythritol 2,4-cyclodiphosphate synthase
VSEIRIGLGLDLHRVGAREDQADLVLGGVRFPGEPTLIGHSDADVIAHAIADAMLGAAGLGDLGAHFPDTDPQWRGADSLTILEACRELLVVDGWRLVNADSTLLCERPKVAPVRMEMMVKLSGAAGGPVHVKATRPEGIGAFGRMEGIACYAVCLLER